MQNIKADNAADFYLRNLTESWPWSIDDLLQDSRYTIIQNQYSGYSEKLVNFFSLAQIELYTVSNMFNNRIADTLYSSTSQAMIGVVTALKDFSSTVMMDGNCRMTVNPPTLIDEISSEYLPLLDAHHSVELSPDIPPINLYPLGATATFGLVDKANKIQDIAEDNTATDSSLVETLVQPSDLMQSSREGSDEDTRKKIYSVFISSTYEDLRPFRQAVMKILQHTEEYNPIGMEDFPAADKNQLDYIEEKMEFVDLYVLILGGRYGSLIPDGTMSYSHKEYEMAREHPHIKTLAFICSDPEDLPSERRDDDPESKARLSQFRQELEGSFLIRGWNHTATPQEIANLVYWSLNATDKTNLQGWIRGPVPSV